MKTDMVDRIDRRSEFVPRELRIRIDTVAELDALYALGNFATDQEGVEAVIAALVDPSRKENATQYEVSRVAGKIIEGTLKTPRKDL